VDPAATAIHLVQPAEEQFQAQSAAEPDVGQDIAGAHRHGGDGGLDG
jgi:hypothetical protein